MPDARSVFFPHYFVCGYETGEQDLQQNQDSLVVSREPTLFRSFLTQILSITRVKRKGDNRHPW